MIRVRHAWTFLLAIRTSNYPGESYIGERYELVRHDTPRRSWDTAIVPFVVRPRGMPTYVLLTSFTQQGIENVRDSPERTDHARELVESLGGTWRDFFVTMGRYDGVVIADFPDEATAAQAALGLAESGNVTTETLRAFSLDEFRDIVDAMA